MRIQKILLFILAVFALLAAIFPLLIIFFEVPHKDFSFLFAVLNCAGWSFVFWFVINHFHIIFTVQRAAHLLFHDGLSTSLASGIQIFTERVIRMHHAAFAYRVTANRRRNIALSLLQGVELAYEMFKAKSVELVLSESESGISSRSLLLGVSDSPQAQSALATVQSNHTSVIEEEDNTVIVKPVVFAKTSYGMFRVQLEEEFTFNEFDRQLLGLIADQTGIILADSQFSEEVLKMRRLNEESTRAKTGFLANLSHEIRGPLGIILNGTELALEGLCGELPKAAKESFAMVKESGEHLLDLVNDVLDYAKVEAGKVPVSPIKISVKDLIDDLTAVIRSQTVAKKQTLVVEDIDPTLGILCDKRHSRQMIINFLTNAQKYTPEGGRITVSAKKMNSQRVRIMITDTGIGIEQEQKHKVFEAFERIDDEYAMKQLGTGLGMPLTKRLAQLNGGSVGFESQQGKGSSFWLILPLCVLDVEDSSESDNLGSKGFRSQGRGETILLVSKDRNGIHVFSSYLTQHSFNVVLAESQSELLKLAKTIPIALALVENDSPELKGEDVIGSIRSIPSIEGIPIVLMSSKAFVFDIERFLKLGVDRCLTKPIKLQELALTVRRLIDEASGGSLDNGEAYH